MGCHEHKLDVWLAGTSRQERKRDGIPSAENGRCKVWTWEWLSSVLEN